MTLMEPKIERIQACVTDPNRQATHIDRATGSVMAHDQIDTYTILFKEDPLKALKEAAGRAFAAAAQVKAEELVEHAKKDFEAVASAQHAQADAIVKGAKEGDADAAEAQAQAIRDQVEEARVKFEATIAVMNPTQVAADLANGFARELEHVRFEDFLPRAPIADIAAGEGQPT